ncbi:MAG TPA: choice-of-anchor D domain-containing protein [Candidatus Kapabacteria bacterium]|nr:choice-of-anchor D domain-containing protein [Candidatus Kapabacteria bacterium]
MLHNRTFNFIFLLISLMFVSKSAFTYEACDTTRLCIGNSLKFTVTTGKGAHYIDVINNSLINKMGKAITFDLWLKPKRQAGKIQYIAGLWGPNFEVNDSWLAYINDKDSLIFQLNGNESNLANEDFTTVSAYIGNLYDQWNHYAFVFNGNNNFAYIYINGDKIDSSRNNKYPLYTLKKINNPELSIQIGSTNALSNDPNMNRTFLGDMDEIRIWGRALSAEEIFCNKDKALNGKEDSLLLYYRCNDPNYVFELCDAAGNGNQGMMRSGLEFGLSDRQDIIKVIASPLSIKDTIVCDTAKFYDFVLTDTSVCATGFYIRTVTGFPEKFSFTYNNKEYDLSKWSYLPLPSMSAITLRIKVNADFVGTISTWLQVRSVNACGYNIANIPITINRQTELNMSKLEVAFDSLKARCIEKTYIDSTITICNTSNRDLTISKLSNNMPLVFKLLHSTLPIVLKPKECTNVIVRFTSRDTTEFYYDTLTINSNDRCANVTQIPLQGKVKEVFRINKRSSDERLTEIDFGTKCVNFPSVATEYDWMNLDIKDIVITDIKIPDNFYGKNFKFPVTLEPNTGYQANYFRFLPKTVGVFNDSIIIVAKSGNCTIHYPIYIKGVAYDADLSFKDTIIDFGSIKVGQELTINAVLNNNSNVSLTSSTYLINGEPFFITGSKSISISANASGTIQITFRPTKAGLFEDELGVYEESCFESYGVKVKGVAYVDWFSYEPEVLEVKNVLGCYSKEEELEIRNLTDNIATLSDFKLIQALPKFTLVEPAVFPSSITINKGESVKFKLRYTPNDIIAERADRALLEYKTQDNQVWTAKLLGTSVLPRLHITSEILFETIEVGGSKQDTIIIENISNFDITINNANIPTGFIMVYPATLNGRVLKPKDTVQVIINFVPTEDKLYSGQFEINVVTPCPIDFYTDISGKGIIVPLDAPLKVINYGFVNPCECEERKIPLINNSFYFPMNIDSILIDTTNVTSPASQFYSWYSFYSPSSVFPYQIPKRSTDTLTIVYCPKSPFIDTLVDNNARLHIYASGSAWKNHFETFLAGKQTLLFQADSNFIVFPPTRVDTVSAPRYIHLFIPGLELNPKQAKVEISNFGFEPDERVFYAEDSLGKPLNLTIDTNNIITLKLEFKPRAVRTYSNKLKISIITPCVHIDTSVTLVGSGFAPAFGLNFSFNNTNKSEKDTLKVINCDTLAIPIYSSRTLPADVVDINCRIAYDTSKLEYLYAESYYVNNPCKSYISTTSHKYPAYGGSEFLLKNACYVDSIRPLFTAYFVPKSSNRDTLEISLDSIKFDTEEIILYHLIAEPDFATVVIQKPEMKAINTLNFDSVQVLDCAQRSLEIVNNGDVPLSLFSLINLPPDIKLISSVPDINDLLQVGDTIVLNLEYCPRKADTIAGHINSISADPCLLIDSTFFEGIAYAPEFKVAFDVSLDFLKIDTITTQLTDTLKISIYNERDFSAIIQSREYWIEKLNFDVNFTYNPFNLEFLSAKSEIASEFNYQHMSSNIVLEYRNTDSLKRGKIADLFFISTVPDTNISDLKISATNFETDSILFLDIKPQDNQAILYSLGKCGVESLHYTGFNPSIVQNSPNPVTNFTTIKFTMSEKSAVRMKLYSINGQLVKSIIDGQVFIPGEYEVSFSTENLNAGVYYYIFETNTYFSSKSMIVIK